MLGTRICGSLVPPDQRRPSLLLTWADTVSDAHPQNTGKLPMHPMTWALNGTAILSIILSIFSAGLFEDVVVTIE